VHDGIERREQPVGALDLFDIADRAERCGERRCVASVVPKDA
jgi:hypothetical protein